MPRTTPSRHRRSSDLVTTVAGNGYLVVGTALFATLAILGGWIPPRGRSLFRCGRWWSALLLAASGVRVEASYEAELSDRRAVVFMANHQSLYDIPVLLTSLPHRTRFVAKRELFKIPLFGWSLAVGGAIPVDRSRRTGARVTFRTAVSRLRDGDSVLVFPEETRSADGRLLGFQRGGFLVALKSGAPIVPVGIDGTLDVRRPGSFVIRGRRVAVRYGRPVSTEDVEIGERDELMSRVRQRIAALSAGT